MTSSAMRRLKVVLVAASAVLADLIFPMPYALL